jgi:hypothetical protein
MSTKPTYRTIAERTRVQASLGCCNVPGCHRPRYRLAPWCTAHRERVRHHGHPTQTPPSHRYRKRLRGHVRRELESLITPEVHDYLERLLERLQLWSESLRVASDLDREHCGRLARVDPLDLLAAAAAFELYEVEYRNDRDPLPYYLAGRPERRERFRAAQLSTWLRDVMSTRGLGSQDARHRRSLRRVTAMLLAWRAPTRLHRLAGRLALLLKPSVRDAMAEESREIQQRERERMERAKEEQYPYGPPDKHGRITIYVAPGCETEP